MIKRTFFFIFLFSLIVAPSVKAQDEHFSKSATVTYELLSDFSIKANFNITILNKESLIYAPAFRFSTTGFNPTALNIFENGVIASVAKEENNVYGVKFKSPAVGIGASKKIVVNFLDNSIVDHTSNLTSIRLPEINDFKNFKSVSISLKVPNSVGSHYVINPTPSSVTTSKSQTTFKFEKDALISPINADFGEFQDYSFKISYPSESFIKKNNYFQIAIPRDTPYQKVQFSDFSQKPDEVVLDYDGNFLATFNNKPKDDFFISGSIRVYPSPQGEGFLDSFQIEKYIKQTPLWQSDNSYIKEIASNLSSPHDIYNYVISTLNYNFNKTNRPTTRMGAIEALKKRDEAICMEFTDLFIALARAKGIPSREVNGYAYTTNPEIQPLSLVSDILHSWPEYWDFEKKQWISIDPTWGDTTNGIDYFSKFDANHIAFVVHGENSLEPITPGVILGNKQPKKLIEIDRKEGFSEKIDFESEAVVTGVPFFRKDLNIVINNTGNVALLDQNIKIRLNNINHTLFVPLIPPYGKTTINVPFALYGDRFPKLLDINYENKDVRLIVKNALSSIYFVIVLIVSLIITLSVFATVYYKYAQNKISKRS